ncbi:MAG: hypothetical protein M0R21_06620 [Lentimicrobiaceae bacterium]|jgi:hypothetical protein|nr:hypothetical protein [Lentimicrobiaceae bacterium]
MEEKLKITDKLFQEKSGMNYDYSSINMTKGLNNDQALFLIAEGYKNASIELLDKLLNDNKINWLKLDSLIYPIVFLFRHHLEIIIKDTIRFENITDGNSFSDEIGFPTEHSLIDLWKDLRPKIEKRYISYDENLKNDCIETNNAVENMISEIDNLDKGSYSFRYPFNKPNRGNNEVNYSLPQITIGLKNLKNNMIKLINYFDGINEQARIALDEKQSNI